MGRGFSVLGVPRYLTESNSHLCTNGIKRSFYIIRNICFQGHLPDLWILFLFCTNFWRLKIQVTPQIVLVTQKRNRKRCELLPTILNTSDITWSQLVYLDSTAGNWSIFSAFVCELSIMLCCVRPNSVGYTRGEDTPDNQNARPQKITPFCGSGLMRFRLQEI